MTAIFAVPLALSRSAGADSLMPDGVDRAFVTCFAPGADATAAVRRVLAAVLGDGMNPDRILEPILTLDSGDWAIHIRDQWPDHAAALPSQPDFEARVRDGHVVYGPFGTYD